MVSMRGVYRISRVTSTSGHRKKRRTLGNHSANLSRGNSVTLQSGDRTFRGLRSDCDQQAPRSLRIEEKILILWRNVRREIGAVTHKSAIVLEPAGEMAFARCFDRTREIVEGLVVNLKGHRCNSTRWITQRHLTRVTQRVELQRCP